jgi:hypothetical protein
MQSRQLLCGEKKDTYTHEFIYNTIHIVTCRPFARERVTNTFPWRWILGNQLVTEHVSWDTKMKYVSTESDSWKATRRRGINRRFRGY